MKRSPEISPILSFKFIAALFVKVRQIVYSVETNIHFTAFSAHLDGVAVMDFEYRGFPSRCRERGKEKENDNTEECKNRQTMP
jgi:hypothetical protein